MNTNERSHGQIFALIAALMLSALLASGCSTPAVSGNSVDTEDSSSSYVNCVRVTSQYGTSYQCNAVSTPTTYSYNRYTYTKSGLTSKVTESQLIDAYATYLSTLEPDQLAELNAQWDALALTK